MASSSSAIIREARRYDVFLSFRGEDTRNGFISHLYEALCKNQISTFIDDKLERGDDIYGSLFTAIEESTISLIIFSENYADSKWCLKELAKILQCRMLSGQIVIPVFYGIEPSDIKYQTGKFGVAFDKLKERLGEGEMDLNEVRSHLKEAANIVGWNSQNIRLNCELIKSIMGVILNKFNQSSNKPNSTMTLWENLEDMNVLKYLQNNNEISWVCQLCGHPFPFDVLPDTFCHHLIMICESALEDVREAAFWFSEAECSRDGGSRSAGSSVESNYVAQTGKDRYDQGGEVSSVRRNWQNKRKAMYPLDSLSPT